MSWPVLIEVWSSEVLAYVPDLPGFQVSGNSPVDALQRAESAAPHYLRWLIEGDMLPERTTASLLILAETLKAAGNAGPFFAADGGVLDPDYVELALTVGRAALSDLLFVRDDIPESRLGEVDRVLRHVAEMERWYANRIHDAVASPFDSIEDELIQSASYFEETIDRTLTGQGQGQDVWTNAGERWSIAKILRRRTGHLREHLPEIMAHLEQ